MIDHFALLDQPRRPWLDPEALKQQFHRLTAEHHPDVNDSAQIDFSKITAAYQTLRDPKSRLKHLIALEFPDALGSGNNVPQELVDLFMQVAGTLSAYTKLLKKLETASSPLARALVANEQGMVLVQLQKLSEAISTQETACLEQLRQFDQGWPVDKQTLYLPLQRLAHNLTFLQKWADQIREAILRLEL